jgi:hypothetical protein
VKPQTLYLAAGRYMEGAVRLGSLLRKSDDTLARIASLLRDFPAVNPLIVSFPSLIVSLASLPPDYSNSTTEYWSARLPANDNLLPAKARRIDFIAYGSITCSLSTCCSFSLINCCSSLTYPAAESSLSAGLDSSAGRLACRSGILLYNRKIKEGPP